MDNKEMFLEFVDDCICGVVVVYNGIEEHYTQREVLEMFEPNNIENITVIEDELEIIYNNNKYIIFGV